MGRKKKASIIESLFLRWVRQDPDDPAVNNAYERVHELIERQTNSIGWMCQTRKAVDDLELACQQQAFGAGFKAALNLVAELKSEDSEERNKRWKSLYASNGLQKEKTCRVLEHPAGKQ